MTINDFIQETKKLGIELDNNILEKLNEYYIFLTEYNMHTNLTRIIEKEDVYLKHFYDSILVTKYFDFNNCSSLLDIGTGAGFPGVVLALLFPNIKVTLLDSNSKKTTFLELLKEKLNINNIEIVHARAEDYAKLNQEKYDVCISRSVAFLDIIVGLSMPFIKKDGIIILMKGILNDELKLLNNNFKQIGIKEYKINNYYLYNNEDERNIIILSKENNIPILSYPQLLKRHSKLIK